MRSREIVGLMTRVVLFASTSMLPGCMNQPEGKISQHQNRPDHLIIKVEDRKEWDLTKSILKSPLCHSTYVWREPKNDLPATVHAIVNTVDCLDHLRQKVAA